MGEYFLAIDIGASGGRHFLGSRENNRLVLEEVYRFENKMDNLDGNLCWDLERLFEEILAGMKKCKEIGKIPISVGIDAWGVDFVLLNKEDQVIGKAVGYRDHRTQGMDEQVYHLIDEEQLYARTGIQKATYNTIYQLMAVKKLHPRQLEEAKTLLMIPDYFHYKLSGRKVQEYSEASTSQLIDPCTKEWDYELIERLGFPKRIFQKIEMPGTSLGGLTEEVKAAVGYDCQVILPAAHDTASAIMAIPSNEENICYISSGTWSLMGIERDEADRSPKSKAANFTNEGGYGGKINYLSNIMGLWMIQSVRNQLAPHMSYEELCERASKERIGSIVDCQEDCFLSPPDMAEEVREYCRKTEQQVPDTLAELASVIYNSLARCYSQRLDEIEAITGRKYDKINVIGGGANAVYLNQLTARYTNASVYAGPGEAAAIGNILAQMLESGVFAELKEARRCVADSFEIRIYE